MESVYEMVKKFKKRHRGGVSWRIRKHAKVIENHINPGEKVLYAFPAQQNDSFFDIFATCIVALTTKRLIFAKKRVIWGYYFGSVTPDLYNDLQVYQGLIWGRVKIDTVKEEIVLSNLPKRSLNEIETNISEFMMKEKQKYKKMGEER